MSSLKRGRDMDNQAWYAVLRHRWGNPDTRFAVTSLLYPRTVLLRRRPTVGVEPWIPFEREKWSYTPRDLILSNRKARGCTGSAAPRMGLSQARRRSWDITPKEVFFGEPWFVLGERGRETACWLDGEKVFSPKCHGSSNEKEASFSCSRRVADLADV